MEPNVSRSPETSAVSASHLDNRLLRGKDRALPHRATSRSLLPKQATCCCVALVTVGLSELNYFVNCVLLHIHGYY